MKIKDIYESSTTAGAIATGSPATIGKTQKRAGSLFQGKVTNKPFYEQEESETEKKKPKKDFGKMFQKKVDQSNKAKKHTEEKVKAHTVKEDEIVEQDLILVPGQIKGKDKSFIPHEKDRRDHEVEMARSELFAAAKDAQRIYAMLKSRTEDEGLMGWQQSYITLAADYLNSVADSLEHQAHTNEMTGGVLAGGMSNFEEGVAEKSHQERLDQRNAVEQIALHNRQDDYFDLFAEWSGKTRPEIYKDRNNHRLAYKLENLGMQIADYWPNQSYYKPGDPKREELYGLMKQWYDLYNKAYNELKKQGVAEGFPQPGETSGKAKQFNPNAKIQTKEMTLDQILNTVKGIPYVNEVIQDWDAKDYSWGVTKKVIEYAQYLQKNPQSVANLPPLVVIDGQLNDGAHRLSAINLLQKRMDPKNPLWKQVKLKVNFGTSADIMSEQGVAEEQAPMFTPEEEQLDEKKDACYSKVKSRYKVWPSAYASGALVKCRKVGASNWGNKSKK